MPSLWITWEDHRRSRELAAHFGAELHVLTSRRSRLLRYLLLSARTLALLLRRRPKTVFCQNPSIVLASWLGLWRPLLGYRLVVDRHSNFKFPTVGRPELKWRTFHALSDWSLRHADATIVTNEPLKEIVERKGGRAFVLQDKLPDLRPSLPADLGPGRDVVFVCTFSEDEPVAAVLEAARLLGPDYHFHVTGRREAFDRSFALPVPDNVTLTGFLPEDDYVNLLAGADALMILTDADYVLNCGSYESVVLGRPMVLTDTSTIRSYFCKGACYVDLDAESIAAGVRQLFADYPRYARDVAELKDELALDWRQRADGFGAFLDWSDPAEAAVT